MLSCGQSASLLRSTIEYSNMVGPVRKMPIGTMSTTQYLLAWFELRPPLRHARLARGLLIVDLRDFIMRRIFGDHMEKEPKREHQESEPGGWE